ncbi:hypothetical protein [Microbacterium sp. CFH 31415]|uniref:hypothetical protein n=1 Tax=Microbacterium sp. CFH 31415 TaxID=2921732 RepID=UPI001F13CA4D|nr:hypothetical protein [Microbacterium sp. CFH 31415]
MLSALWITAALLAGGYARTRNRSALAWFVLTVFLGPIAALLLVVLPARDPGPEPAEAVDAAAPHRTESP